MALIRALLDKSIPGLDEAFGGRDVASEEMQTAIKSWIAEYFRRTPDKESDPCQRLPYTIVHKLEKGMFAELGYREEDFASRSSWLNKRAKVHKAVKQILDAFRQAGYIAGYSETREGNAITGVEILLGETTEK